MKQFILTLIICFLFPSFGLTENYSQMKIPCSKIPAILRISDTEYRGMVLIRGTEHIYEFDLLIELPTGRQVIKINIAAISEIYGYKVSSIKAGELPGINPPDWLLKSNSKDSMAFQVVTRSGRTFWTNLNLVMKFKSTEGIVFDISYGANMTFKVTMGNLP